MLNQPALLLLDEPTASLDPAIAREIRIQIREYAAAGKVGVLWTSHNMYEVEDVCDRVLFLSHGRILLQGVVTFPGFTYERSLEAAALFNPSIVPHPNQSADLPPGRPPASF